LARASDPGRGLDHIPGPPEVRTFNGAFTERVGATHSSAIDTVSNKISFVDINAGDLPTASAKFSSFAYKDANDHDVTATLTAEQLAAIKAVEIPFQVVPDPGNKNTGSATWTCSIADNAFDFLAAGETLTLTYMARVDNNFALNNEFTLVPITITVTGTNDKPTIATSGGTIMERIGTGNTALDTISGTVTFTDVDLTDRPVASAAFTSFTCTDASHHPLTLTPQQLADVVAVEVPLSVTQTAGNSNNGSATWTYSVPDSAFDFLATGEILTLTYTATVNDGHGGVVTKPITVTVTGTNDAPVAVRTRSTFQRS
jgi:VCBS repeat-containing protein